MLSFDSYHHQHQQLVLYPLNSTKYSEPSTPLKLHSILPLRLEIPSLLDDTSSLLNNTSSFLDSTPQNSSFSSNMTISTSSFPSPLYCSSPSKTTSSSTISNNMTTCPLSPVLLTPVRMMSSCGSDEDSWTDRKQMEGRRLFQSMMEDQREPQKGETSAAIIGLLTFILDTEISQQSCDVSSYYQQSSLSSSESLNPSIIQSRDQITLNRDHMMSLNASDESLRAKYPHLFVSLSHNSTGCYRDQTLSRKRSRDYTAQMTSSNGLLPRNGVLSGRKGKHLKHLLSSLTRSIRPKRLTRKATKV